MRRKVRCNCRAGFEHIGNIRLAVFVKGRGDADQDGLDFGDAGEVGGGFEETGVACSGNRRCLNVADIGFAGIDGIDLSLVDVKAEDGNIGFREAESKRKAYVTEADDGYFFHV